jgi:hypothetical protein
VIEDYNKLTLLVTRLTLKFIKVANDIGTYLGLQATVKKVSDPRGDKISLSFHKGGEVVHMIRFYYIYN